MNADIVRLDVRPILAGRRDPFGEIMAAAAKVPAGGTLVLTAPFDPKPLRDVMGTSGFSSQATQIEAGVWEVTFLRAKDRPTLHDAKEPEPRCWSEGADRHVDARGLDGVKAVEAVRAEIENSVTSDKFIAHLDSNIEQLYPVLSRLGWEAAYVPGEAGEVRLEISRPRLGS